MTISKSLLDSYARTRKTKVIEGAFRIVDDSATFVLVSGQKLTMTEDELRKAVDQFDKARAKEEAEFESPADKKARLKAEAAEKKKQADYKLATT